MLAMGKKLIGWTIGNETGGRAQGRTLIGLGIGSTLDSGTNNFGQARIHQCGSAVFRTVQGGDRQVGHLRRKSSSAWVPCHREQGHETTAAQVVADVLGVSPGPSK